MKKYWLPFVITLILMILAIFSCISVYVEYPYKLEDNQKISSYINILIALGTLVGSNFLIFQHWWSRKEYLSSLKPRIYFLITASSDQGERYLCHRTFIIYNNVTRNDFEDLSLDVFMSVDDCPYIVVRHKRPSFFQAFDERTLSPETDQLLSSLGENLASVESKQVILRTKATASFTFNGKTEIRETPEYMFNFSTRTWDIDE